MPCNVRVLAAECCKNRAILRQLLRSLEILTANDQHMVHRYFFTQRCFHKDMFSHMDLHIHVLLPRDGFTRKYLHAQVFFHRDAFISKNPKKTLTHRRVGTSTRRCLYTAMLSQRSAFTRTCENTGLLLTQVSFYTENFTLNTLTQRCSPHRKTFVQRRLFRHMHFYKRIFARIL